AAAGAAVVAVALVLLALRLAAFALGVAAAGGGRGGRRQGGRRGRGLGGGRGWLGVGGRRCRRRGRGLRRARRGRGGRRLRRLRGIGGVGNVGGGLGLAGRAGGSLAHALGGGAAVVGGVVGQGRDPRELRAPWNGREGKKREALQTGCGAMVHAGCAKPNTGRGPRQAAPRRRSGAAEGPLGPAGRPARLQ